MDIKGKVAIVTGGGKGLGKAVALALAKEGVHVGITGRNTTHLESTVEELKQFGVQAAFALEDVTQEAEVIAAIASLVDTLGRVDILINNAGIGDFGAIQQMSSTVWTNVIQTNLFGVYFNAKAVYPYMKDNGEGDIVNIASTAGLKGGANMSAYSASKAAVIALSQSMMSEWRKDNIRVFTLTPSTIATDMAIDNKLTDGNPDKVLQPEDFAQWVTDMLKMERRALIANGSIFSTNP